MESKSFFFVTHFNGSWDDEMVYLFGNVFFSEEHLYYTAIFGCNTCIYIYVHVYMYFDICIQT